MLHGIWSLALIGTLIGCGVRADSFPAALAQAECDLYEACDLLDGFADSHAECVAIIQAQEQGRVSADDCDYSRASAGSCVRQVSDATCEDLGDAALEGESPCEMVCAGR